LETRKLKAGIRDGIKQETKEQEKSKLMELSAKYTAKPMQSSPIAKQEEMTKQSEPKQVQQTAQPQPYHDNVRMDPTKGMQPAQPTQPARPKYFLPTMSHAKKWNTFNNPL
jgi:hypothetical protein